jgi:hypothetical protein
MGPACLKQASIIMSSAASRLESRVVPSSGFCLFKKSSAAFTCAFMCAFMCAFIILLYGALTYSSILPPKDYAVGACSSRYIAEDIVGRSR